MAAASGIPRTRGGLCGLLLILLGAWGALVPFVGPYFHFAYTPDRTWAYTSGRLWLEIVPGAAAVVGGLIVLGTRNRMLGGLGAFLAALGGAWFVVGGAVIAQLVKSGSINGSINPGLPVGITGGPAAASLRQFLEGLGFFTGTGVLIVFFAALALGRFSVAGGLADEQEPWAAHPVPLDEARHQDAFPASQDQFPASQDQFRASQDQSPTIASQYPPAGSQYPPAGSQYPPAASQYPPAGSQPSPAGQVPPQQDASGQQREQDTSGPQREQSPTAVGQVPSSPTTEQFPASSSDTEQFPAS